MGVSRRSWSIEAFHGACAPEPSPWVMPMAPAAGERSVGPLSPHGATWAGWYQCGGERPACCLHHSCVS